MAVYMTALKPGDTVLGMNLAHGGHLTHGHPLNFLGAALHVRLLRRRQGRRADRLRRALHRLAAEHRPKMIIVGASAYPRVIDFARIRAIADASSAIVFTDMAHIAGLVAAGIHPTPGSSLRFRLDDDPQDAARTARRDGAVPGAVREGSRSQRLSGRPGRPAHAHHRGQGRLLQGSRRSRRSAPISSRLSPTPRGSRRAGRGGVPARQRRHRQPPDARGRLFQGHHGQGRRSRARQGRHHGQQERHPVRPESADGRERHPHRHARGHDARHARSARWNRSASSSPAR